MAKRSAEHLLAEMKNAPLIIATIPAKRADDFMDKVSAAKSLGAKMVELRQDFLDIAERVRIPDMVQMSELPIITTCRKQNDGGRFSENEETRVKLQKDAMEYGAQFVDIEANTPALIRHELVNIAKKNDVKIIISRHERNTPSLAKMREIHEQANTLHHDMIKLVFTPNSKQEGIRILEVAQSLRLHRKPYSVFGMGEYGRPTRVFSLMLGGSFMYCSLDRNGNGNNLHQVSIADMKHIFDMVGSHDSWRKIRRDPEWVMDDIVREWAERSDENYNNMTFLKRTLRAELNDFLEDE